MMQAPRRIAFTVAMQFAFALMIVGSLCVKHEAKRSASIPSLRFVSENMEAKDQKAVVDAINRLKASCDEWKHLDPGIVSRVAQQAKFGPEANVKVRIQDKGGMPVSGALVLLVESEFDINYIEPTPRSGKANDLPLALRATDEKGEAIFSSVRRTHPGLRQRNVTTIANSYCVVLHPDYAWTGKRVEPNSDLQTLEFELEESHDYLGRIVDEMGHGVENITFIASGFSQFETAWGHSSPFTMWYSHFRPRSQSDAKGFYRFKCLPRKGWIDYRLEHPNWRKKSYLLPNSSNDSADRSINLENKVTDLVVEPVSRQTCKFRLLDSKDGKPIPGARIMNYPTEVANTGDDGVFEISNYATWFDDGKQMNVLGFSILATGEYFGVSYSGEIPSQESIIDIRLQKGVRIQGKVVDETTGLQIPEVCIQGKAVDPNDVQRLEPIAATTTGKNGQFSLVVPQGKVDVQIISGVYGYEVELQAQTDPFERAAKESSWKPTSVTIDTTDKTSTNKDIVFSLKRIRPIRGSVVDEDNVPIKGALVYTTSAFHEHYWKSTAKTNGNGEFEVMPPPGFYGTFKLVVEHGDRAFRQELRVNQLGSYVGPPIAIQLTNAHPIHAVAGYVVVDGKGLPGAQVGIYEYQIQVDPNVATSRRSSPDNLVGSSTTDGDGYYEIRTPVLSKQVELNTRILNPGYLSFISSSPKAITPKGLRTVFPDLEFKTRFGDLTVSCEVITPDGEPVEGATIQARYLEQDANLIRRDFRANPGDEYQAITDADGKFVCKDLGKGKVQLLIRPGATTDPCADALSYTLNTVGGKEGLIFVVDPKLAKPPESLEPIKVIPIEARASDAAPKNGREAIISGRIVDSMQKPIKNVLIKVFAARPLEGLPTHFPLAHPLCDLETRTDAEGNYTLRVPSTTDRLRLIAYLDQYEGQMSEYLDCSMDQEWNLSLVEPKNYSTSIRTVVDENQTPISDVVTIHSDDGFMRKEVDEIELKAETSVSITNQQGRHGPLKDSGSKFAFMFKKGLGANMLPAYASSPYLIKPSYSIEGRIVDDKGPLSNYPLLLCGRPGSFHIRIKTDADGKFRVDELRTLDDGDGEVHLSSDLAESDPRGWLKTRSIKRAKSSDCLQLSDLKVSPTRTLIVNLVDTEGKSVDTAFEIELNLRQQGKGISFKGKGTTTCTSLPNEPILFRMNFTSPHEIISSVPLLAQAGFKEWTSYATQLEEDSEVTFTVVPR